MKFATRILQKLENLIVPNRDFFENANIYYKGKLLSYSLFASIFICITLHFFHIIYPQYYQGFPFIGLMIFMIGLLLFYKYTGFRQIVSNILCFTFCGIMIYGAYKGSRLYSDAIFWLVLAPIFSFMLLDKNYGALWSYLVQIIIFFFFIQQKEAYFYHSPLYYYTSIAIYTSTLCLVIYSYTATQEKMNYSSEKQSAKINNQNKELTNISEQLSIANKDLQNFVYTTAHDIKQPIRSINNFAQLLFSNLEKNKQLDESNAQYLNQIITSGNTLYSLIDSILDFSDLNQVLDNITSHTSEVNLNQILNSVLSNLNKQIDENNATININQKLPTIIANQNLILRLFQNIISNAIKYKKENTPPVITIHFEEKKEYWSFSIADNGIGIPPDSLKKVFTNFYTLKTTQKGHGMGLAICKKIIESHQGTITAKSDGISGSVFSFTIKKHLL